MNSGLGSNGRLVLRFDVERRGQVVLALPERGHPAFGPRCHEGTFGIHSG